MVRITVLTDNRCALPGCGTEHGLSLFIEAEDTKLLFDTGASGLFLENAEKLGIRPEDADAVVLSHGDWDHSGGLKFLRKKHRLVIHPDCESYRFGGRKQCYGGMDLEPAALRERFAVEPAKAPLPLGGGITYLGEIERHLPFEGTVFPFVDKENKAYTCPDDSGLVIAAPEGIVVVSGCAHSGICNTVEYAKKISGIAKVRAVMGGFHLLSFDENAAATLEYMKQNTEKVILGHCTADEVCRAFEEAMPGRAETMGAGKVYEF